MHVSRQIRTRLRIGNGQLNVKSPIQLSVIRIIGVSGAQAYLLIKSLCVCMESKASA